MKSLIVYSSQTGNTRKLAEAVRDVLPGATELVPVEEAPADLDQFDLIAVGFWFMAGEPDPKSAEFLGRIGPGRLFLFATHGAAKGSAHAVNGLSRARGLAGGAEVIGAYSCQGRVQAKVIEKAGARPEPPAWLADAPAAEGHPDATDLAELQEAVREAVRSLA